MKNISSFGPLEFYICVVMLVEKDKHLWRKVANIINTVRRNMKPWTFVDKELQFLAAKKYVDMSIQDTKLPENVRDALKKGLSLEFKFDFE